MPKPKAAACNYDVVWYWSGGTEGCWSAVYPHLWPKYHTVEALVAKIEKQGYTARRGALSIGPPEGPPAL